MPNPLNYPGYTPADTAPYYNSAAVTPSDSKDLPIVSRPPFQRFCMPPGVILPIRVKRVWATSTEAGAIVALN